MSFLPFASSSPFNQPIPANPVLDPQSAALARQLAQGDHVADIVEFGVPCYDATGQSMVRVRLTEQWGDYSSLLAPVTAGHTPSTGSDAAMVVYDRNRGYSYEFWQYQWNGGRPQAAWGAAVSLTGPGNDPNAPTGSNVSRLAGVVRNDELAARAIPHALVFSTDMAHPSAFRYPALKTDAGQWPNKANPKLPEGARVQLDPTFDVNTLPRSSYRTRAVAKALQTFGCYCIDHGGSRMAFVFEPPALGWPDYTTIELPWDRLRVLRSWDGT